MTTGQMETNRAAISLPCYQVAPPDADMWTGYQMQHNRLWQTQYEVIYALTACLFYTRAQTHSQPFTFRKLWRQSRRSNTYRLLWQKLDGRCQVSVTTCANMRQDAQWFIATHYGLEGPRIEPRWGANFPHLSRSAPRPTQPPVQWILGLSRW
jgi:hypothetical protein